MGNGRVTVRDYAPAVLRPHHLHRDPSRDGRGRRRTARTTSVPLVAQLSGLIVVLGLIDPVAGHACSITVWQTPTDRERGGIMAPGAGENLALYADALTGPYVRDLYTVTVYTLPHMHLPDTPTLSHARMTTIEVQSDAWVDDVRPS